MADPHMLRHVKPLAVMAFGLILSACSELPAMPSMPSMPDLSFIGLGGGDEPPPDPKAQAVTGGDLAETQTPTVGAPQGGQQAPQEIAAVQAPPAPSDPNGEQAFIRYLADSSRAIDAAFLLMSSATALCSEHAVGQTGLLIGDRRSYPPPLRKTADRMIDFGGRLTVIARASYSPGHDGGFEIGDRIVRIAGRDLPPGERGWKYYPSLIERSFDPDTGIAMYDVQRGRRPARLPLRQIKVCPHRVLIVDSVAANGRVDGAKILMSQALIQRVADPLVLHGVMAYLAALTWPGSQDSTESSWFMGEMFDWLPGAESEDLTPDPGEFIDIADYDRVSPGSNLVYPQADVLSVYLMAYAGLDYQQMPAIFQALADNEELRYSGQFMASYPLTNNRLTRMREAVAMIDRQRRAGEPLVPQFTVKLDPNEKATIPVPQAGPGQETESHTAPSNIPAVSR